MEQATHPLTPGVSQGFFPASITLAFQRLRQAWRLLSLVAVGMLLAVTVVCAVPLYARVAMTAGLRSALSASSQSTDIVVHGLSSSIDARQVDSLTRSLDTEFQQHLGSYLLPGQFEFQAAPLNIQVPDARGVLQTTGDGVEMTGVDTARAAPHLRLAQGRLPADQSPGDTIEVAIRTETAVNTGWKLNTRVPLRALYNTNDQPRGPAMRTITLQIVGIFQPLQSNDPFWHGEDFLGFAAANDVNFIAGALASNAALLALFSQPFAGQAPLLATPNSLNWFYSLDPTRVQITQVDDILNSIQTVEVDLANNPLTTVLGRTGIYEPSGALPLYQQRLPIVQFPVTGLTLLVLALALFFVTLMTGILVERQAGAIAILRSRGASASQIFWSLVTQAIGLALISLLLGPPLALLVVHLLAWHILTVADLGALNILDAAPLSTLLGVSLYALGTAAAMALTMILAIWSTSSRDVLALRRETARSTHRPFWQRLNLDLLATMVALLGAGLSLYFMNSSALDARSRLLYLAPLTLLETLCILLAAMLLLLRGFPWLLRGGAWLTARLRGASSLVALAQMSRAPRQSIRMTLLLALATAFTIFTLVFNASQAQRVQDVADYQAMADFSGNVPVAVIPPQHLASALSSYNRLPGVLSSSMGYAKRATAGGAVLSLPIDFKAVDAGTFAQTARWSARDSAQTLPELMRLLQAQRPLARQKNVVAALVDATAWDELHLTQGATFTLNFSLVGALDLVTFKAIAKVQHIPSQNSATTPGILADYTSFVSAYTRNFTTGSGLTVPLNYVWLRTSDDAAQLASLRHALNKSLLYLAPLYDRRQMVQQLSEEPLDLTLFGILLLGALTALLLALLGNLVASWLNASGRLIHFAALRALGATPRQIASTLAWEQVIIYTTAMALGFFFGWLLSVMVLPSLIFTSILPDQITGSIDSQTFYAAQSTPPIQIVVPSGLWLALGVLIGLCVVALGMMVRIVSRPSIAQVLRLNED